MKILETERLILRKFETRDIDYLLTKSQPYRRVGFDPNCVEAELTYALGRPYWKQGFATEMGLAIIPYGFEILHIGCMIQGVLAHNHNSINLMRRLGFRVEEGLSATTVVGTLDDYAGWKAAYRTYGVRSTH